jgi:hypothetical protein
MIIIDVQSNLGEEGVMYCMSTTIAERARKQRR